MRNEYHRQKTNRTARARKAAGAHRQAEKERRVRKWKLSAMVSVFFLCFIYLSYVIIDIKMVNGDEYEAKAITQLINGSLQGERTIVPMRGSIVDRNMQSLAVSTKVYTVYIDPRKLVNDNQTITQMTKNPETGEETPVMIKNPKTGLEEPLKIPVKEDSLAKLQKGLALSDDRMKEIESYLVIVDTEKDEKGKVVNNIPAKDNHYEIIAKEVPAEKAAALEALNAKHVYLEADSKRNYVNGALASSVVGFVRGDTSLGLEKQYNEYLAGTPGRTFQVYSNEGYVETQKIDAKDGDTVVTTIDLAIQKFAEDAVLKYGELYDAESASAIVMGPKTGELFAMASYPSFDLNDVTNLEYITKSKYREEWKALEGEALYQKLDTVWRNFNITGTFEPGSIYKPMTVAAALEEGIVSPESTFVCPGSKTVSGIRINCNKLSGHGTITLTEAVAQSCNVAMMDIAERMGKDIFYKYQKDFGFGEKTGVDLPYEREDTDFLLHRLENLGPVELATSSFGQRFNATPLQDVTGFASIVNGGNLMKPYIVSQIIDAQGTLVKENTPTVIRKVIAPSTSDYLRAAMEKTVSDGTGWRAKIDGWSIGGKTGTGEQGIAGSADYHYTLDFIAYFPVENPQYVVMVAIDNPNMATYVEGETSPGPMIKEIIQNIIRYQSIPPTDTSGAADNLANTDRMTVGNYVGRPLRETISELNRLSLGFELMGGNGTIVSSQFPAAETKLDKGKVVLLTVSNGADETELTTVPNVVGLTQLQAEEMLTALQLSPWLEMIPGEEPVASAPTETAVSTEPAEPEQETPPGEEYTVEAQMPEADKKIAAGTEVKIKLKKKIAP